MGTKQRCQGAKEQMLINKTINYSNGNNLNSCWLDVQKAYDSVQHEYLMECIQQINIPSNICEFVDRMLKCQKSELIMNRETIGTIKLTRGIIQGDSMSPILFVIAMEPLSRKLNSDHPMVEANDDGVLARNHLIFIDDIKLMARNQEDLVKLSEDTQRCLQIMGLKINANKSATNVDDDRVCGKLLNDQNGYRYLGLWEDAKSHLMEENKEKVKEKHLERVEMLCTQHLSARNFFHAINEFAISTINYYVGILNYNMLELVDLDGAVRRILLKNNIIRNASNTERLYLPRSEMGRGLTNICDRSEIMLTKLYEHLGTTEEREEILKNEKNKTSLLGLINEHIRAKYNIGQEVEVDEKKLKQLHRTSKLDRILEKSMHSRLFNTEENTVNIKESSNWLLHGYLTPQEEGSLCKIQDRNVFFNNAKCKHCQTANQTVDHLATKCGKLLEHEYKHRHDEVAKAVHHHICYEYGLTKKCRKNYTVQPVIANERVRIKFDQPITTDTRVAHNRPDILVHDLRRKVATIIEIGITCGPLLANVETTKARKYEHLAGEIRGMFPGTTVNMIPIVMSWDGRVTKHFKRYTQALGMTKHLRAYIQGISLKKTRDTMMMDLTEPGLLEDYNNFD